MSKIAEGLFLLLGKLPVVVVASALVWLFFFFFSSQKLLSKKELIAPNTVRGLSVLQTRSKYPFCCTKRSFCLGWLFDAIEVLSAAH